MTIYEKKITTPSSIISGPPRGNNSLDSKRMFEERKYYKERIWDEDKPTPLDLWYKDFFYGQIDRNGNALFPQEKYLTQLPSNNQSVWVLDFVADAFNDFKSHYLFLNKEDVAGTPFETLTPFRGWESPTVAYKEHLQLIYKNFLLSYMDKLVHQEKLVDFSSFLKLFRQYAKFNSGQIPFTLSQFLCSPYSSPLASGLMIEISQDVHGDDYDKYYHFIDTDSFECYRETAESYGFKIDKNFPGRMIADISSPAMERYISSYPRRPEPFTQSPPARPTFTFRSPPPNHPRQPFMAGDKVQFAVANLFVPHAESGESPIILRDFTELINRNKPVGERPKVSVVEDEGEVSVYDQLKKLLNVESTTAIIEATILKVDPTLAERIAYRTTGAMTRTTTDSEGRLLTPISSGGPDPLYDRSDRPYAGGDVAIVEFVIRDTSTKGNLVSTPFRGANVDQLDDGYQYLPVAVLSARGRVVKKKAAKKKASKKKTTKKKGRRKAHRIPGTHAIVIEIPLDALHLSPNASPATVERFNRRVQSRLEKQRWESQRESALSTWTHTDLRKYNMDQANYSRLFNQHHQEVNYFRNTPPLDNMNLFNRRYSLSYTVDINLLREMCMQFYHSYTLEKPIITTYKLGCVQQGRANTVQTVAERQQITRQYVEKNFPLEVWLKHYIKIRNFETGNKKSRLEINKIIIRALALLQQGNEIRALKYVSDEFKNSMLTLTL